MGLVMEQMRNMASGRMGFAASRSIMPWGLNQATLPRRKTRVTAPAIRLSSMLRWTVLAMRSNRSEERPTDSGLAWGRSWVRAVAERISAQEIERINLRDTALAAFSIVMVPQKQSG